MTTSRADAAPAPVGGSDPAPPDPSPQDTARLLDFLRGRDVSCPACRYNLRDLTQPVCPECRQALSLTVGVRDLRIGVMLATVAPGIFSGIAAVLLGGVIAVSTALAGAGSVPPLIKLVDLFGWCSGIAAVVLVKYRYAFLRRDRRIQLTWAVATWALHVLVFVLFIVIASGL